METFRETNIRIEVNLLWGNGKDKTEARLDIENIYSPLTKDEKDFLEDTLESHYSPSECSSCSKRDKFCRSLCGGWQPKRSIKSK